MATVMVVRRDEAQLPAPADLQLLYAMLNVKHFGGILRGYRIVYNSRLTSVAGRIGYRPAIIELSLPLLTANPHHLEDTLLHEMVHAWLHHHGMPSGHGPAFKEKMLAVGLRSIYHQLPVRKRPSRRRYLLCCPRCNVQLLRRRKPGCRVSCARCSPKRFNAHVEMVVREL